MIMKYDLLPEFQKYSRIQLPTQPWMLKAANALNARALALYADEKDRSNPLFMPLLSEDFRGFPTAYVETTELFQCE